jgi:hypothetical protein
MTTITIQFSVPSGSATYGMYGFTDFFSLTVWASVFPHLMLTYFTTTAFFTSASSFIVLTE